MRLLTAQQMRNLDRRAIEERGIPGAELMARAGAAVVAAAADLVGRPWPGLPVLVLCGRGNNGGDGFVAARLLLQAGARPLIALAGEAAGVRGDAACHLQQARSAGVPLVEVAAGLPAGPATDRLQAAAARSALVIDALLGTGAGGAPTGAIADLIKLAAAAAGRGVPVLAVDLPSGVEADTGRAPGDAVPAALTVTMIAPKLGLLLEPAATLAGQVRLAPLGVPPDLVAASPAAAELLDPALALAALPPRPPAAHKGSFGTVLVVAGSAGMTGAACLAAEAALRAGAGLCRLAVPHSVQDVVAAKTTEVMTAPLPETVERTLAASAYDGILALAEHATVVALGPGLSRHPDTAELVRRLLPALRLPLVLDADGLSALAGHADLLAGRPAPTIITPHPGEMARLLGVTIEDVQADRPGVASRAAAAWRCTVVLKGRHTIIAEPAGDLLVNPTGNSGLATGGAGDVLTGLLAGLLAQGVTPRQAAAAGVYLHGLAGDLAAAKLTPYSLLAGDLLQWLPAAFRAVLRGTAPAPLAEVTP